MIITQHQVAKMIKGPFPPSSKLVLLLLRDAGALQPLAQLRVLDLTYGQGIWWLALPQARVAALDIRRLVWRRRPTCFLQRPSWAWRYYTKQIEECLGGPPHVVAADPPFQLTRRGRELTGRYHYRVDKMVGQPDYILQAAAVAAKYWGAMLLVHYRTSWVPQDFRVMVEVWWQPWLPAARGYRSWWAVLAPQK